ncbi:hypothetical protein HGRIS_008535 [Hohenbuehelia grisea]|uniref:MOSC domain-containing protein n=1 Tax=Hohenbuehelia grisea TaxID=104357 RepID=A0ABR3J890_9AGAR
MRSDDSESSLSGESANPQTHGHRISVPSKPTLLIVSWLDALTLVAFFTIVPFLLRRRRLGRSSLARLKSIMAPSKDALDTVVEIKRVQGEVKIAQILVHPIKSCKGTSVQSALCTPEGLENDRRWSIIDASTKNVLTARELPTMVLITPRIEIDENSASGGSLIVTFPIESGSTDFSTPLRPTEDILKTWRRLSDISLWESPAIDGYITECLPPSTSSPSQILSVFLKREVYLAYKGPIPREYGPTATFPDLKGSVAFQDLYPLLFMSAESTSALDEWVVAMESEGRANGRQLIGEEWRNGGVKVERFRPNIVVTGAGPFAEDGWTEIAIGNSKEEAERAPPISLVSKCQRCLLPNISPETGVRDKAVPYKVLMKHRIGIDPLAKMKPYVGVNGVPTGSGVVKVGDWVDVRKYADDPL